MQPKIGNQTSKNPAIFRTLVHKKITVVYKYKPLKKEIELITFWNNQQDPKKLKF
jgi:hypothetical protein